MVAFNFAQESERVENALRQAFPNAAIVTSEGWHGRVHAKIVSPTFNGKNEREKQDQVWDVLRSAIGADSQTVALILVYGTDEL